MKVYAESEQERWEVPYLPIDPTDVGRTYESIIRINSQSGKGGIAYVMEKEYGMVLPKRMHPEFARLVQRTSDEKGTEIRPEAIWEVFEQEYLAEEKPLALGHNTIGEDNVDGASRVSVEAVVVVDGAERTVRGAGNGPIDAFADALKRTGFPFSVTSYSEHALSTGSDSKAAAYVEVERPEGVVAWGVGIDNNIHRASFKAILCGLNRAMRREEKMHNEQG
jgi:2-isopropylmalate synthase